MEKIVILGNGIAGITAARHIRKVSDNEILVISSETDHFFSRTALMYIYMGHMTYENTKPYEDWFWEKSRIDLLRDYIEEIDFEGKKLKGKKNGQVSYDKLILAVGSKSNKFGWPGQDLKGVQGLYSYQDLQLMEENTKGIDRAVVVGGGLIGIEMAEMLATRNIKVTFLVREDNFWDIMLPKEEAQMIDRHILEHHIDLRLSTELKEILGDEQGRVRAVGTKEGEEIPCKFVGLTVGVSPNIDFLKESELETEKGILVDEYLQTNITDVYAIGDCVQLKDPPSHRRAIEPVWYAGRMMGETVAHTVCGNRTKYRPGPWFNSAKFLDIEYQTYGKVHSKIENGLDSFYWEHKDGKKCVRFVYEKDSGKFLGLNNFGIRVRHKVLDKWIKEGKDLRYVLENLREINFDPEFFDRHEEEIVTSFNEANPDNRVVLKKKSLFSKIFA